jgi:hypothetical protein
MICAEMRVDLRFEKVCVKLKVSTSSLRESLRLLNQQVPNDRKRSGTLAVNITGGPCWGTYGLVALHHQRQILRCHGMEGGQVQALDFLVTQCPTCPIAALLYALVSDAEGPYLNRLSLSGRPSLSLTFARPN